MNNMYIRVTIEDARLIAHFLKSIKPVCSDEKQCADRLIETIKTSIDVEVSPKLTLHDYTVF